MTFYNTTMRAAAPILNALLKSRVRKGKEEESRLSERRGIASKERPKGKLVWFHAASVGESQATLMVMERLLEEYEDIHILITTGTVTSARLMQERLPEKAIHQYYPLDNPQWVEAFLDHWQPDLVLWMESEIWPAMLGEIKNRDIPAVLVNAHLSDGSIRKWKILKPYISSILSVFKVCLAQTEKDADALKSLGHENVIVTDNLKYSAVPLPFDKKKLEALRKAIGERPFWLYASTHEGEEDMACRIHRNLASKMKGLLTIIIPRHPERRKDVLGVCKKHEIQTITRGPSHNLPRPDDQVYVVDTLGELGLFYKLAQIACIGRSFSLDGGGGHNPIEAALLDCAILHGPKVQNLQEVYDELDQKGAALKIPNEIELLKRLEKLLKDEDGVNALQNKALDFVHSKARVIDRVMNNVRPYIENSNEEAQKCA